MASSVREKRVEQIRSAKRAMREAENAPEMVRARDEKGHFVKDDPSTPENEAWVEKAKAEKPKRGRPSKKAPAKKKTAAKKSA
jgi:hypothetical protein